MNTVYHAALLLSRVTQVGLAYGTDAATTACVIDLAAPPGSPDAAPPTLDRLVRYPWPGMILPTGTFRPNQENPRPAPGLLAADTAGRPVLVGLRDVGDLCAAPTPRPSRSSSSSCAMTATPPCPA